MSSIWTIENVDKARNLAASGLSAAMIADQMGDGFTRNAVVGIGHRKGFHFLGMNKKQGKPKPKPNRVTKALMQCESIPSEPDPPRQRLTFAELQANSCRYPHGDPQKPGFSFCGKNKIDGIPYCRQCAALCYEPRP